MKRFRNGKIVATLGPATSDKAAISTLFEAGADVFRMNFSHGGHEDHATRIGIIRELESLSSIDPSVLSRTYKDQNYGLASLPTALCCCSQETHSAWTWIVRLVTPGAHLFRIQKCSGRWSRGCVS